MSHPELSLLALLYAGPDGVVVREGGRLVVVPSHRADPADVVLTQEDLLVRGVEALLDLVA